MIKQNYTSVIFNERISLELNIDLKTKYEHFFPYLYGGSKARKLSYIIQDAIKKGANAIVSTGAANSNHARDCALICSQLGWKCRLIIHDFPDYSKNNLFLMKLLGAELLFVNQNKVSDAMNKSMNNLKDEGYFPYYIWGGGHSLYGTLAYYDAVSEFKTESPFWKPDYVVFASGTGGTQAGLHIGFNKYYPECKVIGISVSRKKERGKAIIIESIKELSSYLNEKEHTNDVIFYDEWIGEGYGESYPRLLEVVSRAAKYGLLTDLTYTGKALTGLYDLVESGQIPHESKVLFWHTGGLLNLLNDKQLLGI